MKRLFHMDLAAAMCVGVCLAGLPVSAQVASISPDDLRQQARFDAVVRAVARAGYKTPNVVGMSQLSDKKARTLFALVATHADQGVLIVVSEPSGGEAVHPVEIESGAQPAELAVHGVRFAPFLTGPDLVDVVVGHHPFQLEMSSTFERHHVLRRKGNTLTVACAFDGDATSGYAKGPRSVQTKRSVGVTKVGASAFEVKSVEETTERSGRDGTPTTTRSPETTTRYELTPSGTYEPVKK